MSLRGRTQKAGATGLFTNKYGDIVKVYTQVIFLKKYVVDHMLKEQVF